MQDLTKLFLLLFIALFIHACGSSSDAATQVPVTTLDTHRSESAPFGSREITPTPLSKGTLFASVSGTGELCEAQNPCSIERAFSKLQAGSVLFLRGGIYNLKSTLTLPVTGKENAPITIESYPYEKAILNGNESMASIQKNDVVVRDGIFLQGRHYVTIRNVEITNMGASGIELLYSSHDLVEGCHIHHNYKSGVSLYGGAYNKPYIAYTYGYNTIQDNIIHHNSDAGLNAQQKAGNRIYSYEDGDNADGISVSSGKENIIRHNTVYANSDDGIDLWRSNDSYVAYNRVYDNGRGTGGNGNGIKAGGNLDPDAPNGRRAVITHNLSYNNKRQGFDINSGKEVTFSYNTAFGNKAQGFTSDTDTIVIYNIAAENAQKTGINVRHEDNSWQIPGIPQFISTDPNDADFLKPLENTPFHKMGVYADEASLAFKQPKALTPDTQAKIFLIGDSTVHNLTAGECGWGTKLALYMKHPENLFNFARSGASSYSFLKRHTGRHDWESLKAAMQTADLSHGAYLLIQFGHNNKDKDYKHYHDNLDFYIKEARTLGVIPVLITPVERLYKNVNSQGKFPETMRKLAAEEKVLLLDLHAKSFAMFNTYKNHKAIQEQFAYDDITHFNPEGAAIIASWLKELACHSDQKLCSQFK